MRIDGKDILAICYLMLVIGAVSYALAKGF